MVLHMLRSQPFHFALAMSILVPAQALAAQSAADKKASDEQITRLIEQLSDVDFKIRERATRQLKELDEALPALRQALKNADLEKGRRLHSVINVVELRLAERFIKAAVANINAEGIDLFIDRMVLGKDYATEARWKIAIELASALTKRASQFGLQAPKALEQDYLKLSIVGGWGEGIVPPARVLLRGTDRRTAIVQRSLILSSKSLDSISILQDSILFVNGDIKHLAVATNSVVFCNGTIKQLSQPKNSIIFCNGVVESLGITQESGIFVRGELRQLGIIKNSVIEATELQGSGITENNTFLNQAAIFNVNSRNDRFQKAEPSPLSLFRYFSPEQLGMSFTMVDGDVHIDKVTPEQPLAQAGLLKGDLILAVDREKFLSREAFTTLMRRRVVAGEALLKIQRGDRVLQKTVQFPP